MSGTSVLFLIPLDLTRHARFAENLLKLQTPHSEVIVILTRDSERQQWAVPSIPTIVLSDWIPEEVIVEAEKRHSMPTFKKWCALSRLAERKGEYKFIICCDSEIAVLRPIDEQFVASLPSQFVYAGDHLSPHPSYDVYRYLLSECQSRMPLLSPDGVSRHGCDTAIYTWWSGLPVYATGDSLREFLRIVGVDDPALLAKTLHREVFDHIVYQYYAVARGIHGARFLCFTHDTRTPVGWSLEATATPSSFRTAEQHGLAILWMSREDRLRIPQYAERVYLEYHLDH